MITNDIQELLEGSLSDDRMAELLHLLSVSPEKRAAFRQHMALDTAIEQDRIASALTGVEDAAIWATISGGGVAATASSGPTTTFLGWFARAAAVVVVGVGGYLLGTNPSTNIFRSSATDHPAVAQQAVVPERSTTTMTAPATSSASENLSSSPASAPSQIIAGNSAVRNAGTQMVKRSSGPNAAVQSSDRSGSSKELPNSVQDQTPADNQKVTENRGKLPLSLDLMVPLPAQTSDNSLLITKQAETPTTTNPPEHRNGASDIPAETPTTIAALRTNGVEIGFSERVGRITPTPQGIDDPDPEFSNRSFDISYRHFDGRVGAGVRATYGTFSSVMLEATTSGETGITAFNPKLEAQKGWIGEFFVNYRLPLGEHFAIGSEVSIGGSSTYTKASADLLAIWFVTDHIGMQVGGGVGNYWYNLSSQREQLFRDNPNAGINSDASDKYHGQMLEGRYGLFFRF